MPRRSIGRPWILAVTFGSLLSTSPLWGQTPPKRATLPPALEEIRKASVSWERRTGPNRRVVDQVCLVPDLATFFEVIATWDEGHYFPILFDDIDYSFKFLRAFKPARIVRFPRKPQPIDPSKMWEVASLAVARSWGTDDTLPASPGIAETIPKRLGATPPSMVLSSPSAPMLAGAVALAAGRFQPLLNWEPGKGYNDILSGDQAQAFALSLEERIADRVTKYARMNDDCDFITLAGDWPYRYEANGKLEMRNPRVKPFFDTNGGPLAIDDLVGRAADDDSRWAFTGRLLGDAKASVYSAMCSLFLQPHSAVLVNTYDEKDKAWSFYTMTTANEVLEKAMSSWTITHHAGAAANITGWHHTFDPVNRFGLVMINSHGGPTHFHVTDGTANTSDVPPTDPAAVVMIHSFSAANPNDPATIAGRWLANGAYVYFGSMNEPSLQAFRPPTLVSLLLAENYPLGAALRRSTAEDFGTPWRLLYIGDPLYRVKAGAPIARIRPKDWAVVTNWPRYSPLPSLEESATNEQKIQWAVKTSLSRFQREDLVRSRGDLSIVLRSIPRNSLSEPIRPILDSLLADTLLEANRLSELHERFSAIPQADRTPAVNRALETCRAALFERYSEARDFTHAEKLWSEAVRAVPSRPYVELITAKVGALADTPPRKTEWASRLKAAERDLKQTEAADVIAAERKRVEKPE